MEKAVHYANAHLHYKTKNKMIKTETPHFSNVLLTGTILLANADMAGLVTYGVKAAIGGAIWLGYKLAADYIDRKRKPKN